MNPNEVLYQATDVRITGGSADFYGTTYAVRNITSVRLDTEPSQRGAAIVLAVLCAVGTVLGFANNASLCAFIALAITICCGLFALIAAPKYHITLMTSGGEIRAHTTADQQHAGRISDALRHAITR
jgi:hypothetical protein